MLITKKLCEGSSDDGEREEKEEREGVGDEKRYTCRLDKSLKSPPCCCVLCILLMLSLVALSC